MQLALRLYEFEANPIWIPEVAPFPLWLAGLSEDVYRSVEFDAKTFEALPLGDDVIDADGQVSRPSDRRVHMVGLGGGVLVLYELDPAPRLGGSGSRQVP